jgi:hypothetical protein
MPVPEALKEFVDGARSSIERAHNLNATAAARNAEVQLRSAQAYVQPSAAVNEAFDDAIGRVADFHEEVADQNTLIPRQTAAIQNARGIAIVAIDRLEDALVDAKPSDQARAIGLDWLPPVGG